MIGMIVWSCQRDEAIQPQDRDQDGIPGTPLELDIPDYFPDMDVPADNPTTKEGVKLGRMLFYDPILSADSTISCATCHKQENAFASNVRFNRGVQGMKGARNAMSLANVGFYPRFNWHGDAESLEEQAIEPVLNPLEMTASWPDVVDRLKRHPRYPELFRQAFGDEPVSQELVTKAIAQFERTLISHNSKWDRVLKEANQTGQRIQQVAGDILSPSELRGLNLFNTG
jgi:cytochrome c peroxidase